MKVAPGRLPGAEHGLAAGMEGESFRAAQGLGHGLCCACQVDEEGRLKAWRLDLGVVRQALCAAGLGEPRSAHP